MAEETELMQPAESLDDHVVAERAEHEALKTAHADLQAQHAALQQEHEDLKVQFGLAKKAYVWKAGDSECAPVPHDGTCPECGWTASTKEPHPVL